MNTPGNITDHSATDRIAGRSSLRPDHARLNGPAGEVP
jgi:hypothetical protein